MGVLSPGYVRHAQLDHSKAGGVACTVVVGEPCTGVSRQVGCRCMYAALGSPPSSRVMVPCSAPMDYFTMDYFRYMVLVASGFVLGEGIMAIVNALLKTAGVGALSCFGCVEGMCGGAGC